MPREQEIDDKMNEILDTFYKSGLLRHALENNRKTCERKEPTHFIPDDGHGPDQSEALAMTYSKLLEKDLDDGDNFFETYLF